MSLGLSTLSFRVMAAHSNMSVSKSGETGKRDRLRIYCPKRLEGSSPSSCIASVFLRFVGEFRLRFVISVVHLVSFSENVRQVMS